jgi:hypothetical protein
MLFEKQLQLEECLLYYNSGVEIDSDEQEINDEKSDDKKNQEICRVCLSPQENIIDPLISI